MFLSVFESKIELLTEFLNFVKVYHPEKIHIVIPDISLNMSYLYLKKLYENTRALKHSKCFKIRSLNNSKLLSLDQHWHLMFLLFVEIHVYTKRLIPHTSSKLCLT
jgi:hypothetical protein